MDIHQAIENQKLCDELVQIAREVRQKRNECAVRKGLLDHLLVKNFKKIRDIKSNVGIDTAYIILQEINPESEEPYQDWKSYESEYKGLEGIMEAIKTKISYNQSIMKYQIKGEDNG